MSQNTTDKQAYLNATPMQRDVVRRLLCDVLGCLRAQYLSYQTSHWMVLGGSFYGNHLLFQRLYESVQGQVDSLAEKIAGYLGSETLALGHQMKHINGYVARWTPISCNHKRGLQSEADLQRCLKRAYDGIKQAQAMSLGLDDWLMATANAHEENEYLLQQALAPIPGEDKQAALQPQSVSIADVERFVKRLRTYMDVDRKGQRSLHLITRESGDVGDEEPGEADFDEARRVARAVAKEFGRDAFKMAMDEIDEWVTLDITLKDRRGASGAPSAEGDFYKAPNQRAVLEFAKSNAITNDVSVAEKASVEDNSEIPEAVAVAEAEEAPPLPTEIAKEPGGKAVSTLNQYVIKSEDPVAEKAVKMNEARMASWRKELE